MTTEDVEPPCSRAGEQSEKASKRPDSWTLDHLENVFDILDSRRVPVNSAERSKRPGTIPYYGATGQVGTIDGFLFDEELILLGEDGAPFLEPSRQKAYIIKGKSWVNNHAHVLRPRGGMPCSFWKYQLDQVDYHPYVSGTTRLKLSQAPMRRIPLLVPPIEEQRQVADALDSYFSRLDEVEAGLERVQRNLRRYRASVLQAAVTGRLVPTEAELARTEGREYEPASELLKRILVERRKKWEESGRRGKYEEPAPPDTSNLPELPEGWCWASIAQVAADTLIGLVRARADQSAKPPGAPYLRMDNLDTEGGVDLGRLVFVRASAEEVTRFALKEDDILFNTRNSAELVGKSAIVQAPLPGMLFNNNLMRIRLAPTVCARFIAHELVAPLFREQIERVKRATTSIAAVYAKDLLPRAIALPPLAEQVRVAGELDRLLSLAREAATSAISSSHKLPRLRQSILRLAFDGRLVEHDPDEESAGGLLERTWPVRAAGGGGAAKPSHSERRSR